jgi:predicted Fe-Mo cluster-binding NifX family protein/ferredoxin
MKIAVTSTGPSMDDSVEGRFGRCAYFLIIDPDTMEFEAVQNPNISLGGGAGIQSAQMMADKNVSVVLTGNCGPNAFQTFGAAGIQVITGVGGTVRQAVRQYKNGEMSGASAPSTQSHFGMGMGGGRGMGQGMGMGGGRGMGRGMGQGMGMGGGRGMGRGMGQGMGMRMTSDRVAAGRPAMTPARQHFTEQSIEDLKAQAEDLEQQLNAIRLRIEEFGGNRPSVSMVAVVDSDECNGCGFCRDVCPREAISLNSKAHVDPCRCTGCGQCVTACPRNALSLQKAI